MKHWGVAIIGECIDVEAVKNFMKVFVQQYVSHGATIATKTPPIIRPGIKTDIPTVITELRDTIIQKLPGGDIQIMLFIMPARNSYDYERLKKNVDCRWGIQSQCLAVAHIRLAQPQYCSNVCMKLNAKLGGSTATIVGGRGSDNKKKEYAGVQSYFTRPTIIFGADVSHPSPGSLQPSMAALTMSTSSVANRYVAMVETNGYRVEMIVTYNIKTFFAKMLPYWDANNKNNKGEPVKPEHVYYFRDGVSEGQYQQVLQLECNDIKQALFDHYHANISLAVIVCSKRHRVRFFPDRGQGDRNSNPHPGTLVERDVTHPTQLDFYLNSHSAIQGTARPVHYHVLLNEIGVPIEWLQQMIYEQCYQYIRSTTPVSLFPAVYYAHLASNRARSHEHAQASEGPRGGQKFVELSNMKHVWDGAHPGPSMRPTLRDVPVEPPMLVPMGIKSNTTQEQRDKMLFSMWYT